VILRIATRRSALALAQSRWVKAELEARDPALTVELREYVTRGDQVTDVPLPQVGGKGLFTREIEAALLAGEADLAVHSLKDLPSEMPEGLVLAAVPERADPADAMVLPERRWHPPVALGWLSLVPPAARVGTGSLRRAAQLRHLRPDLEIADVRGNVDTRLRKLDEGQYHALILAAAGLTRLGRADRITARLPFDAFTPAAGQGALALQCRAADAALRERLHALEHLPSRIAVTAERSVLEALGGGCSTPVGVFAAVEGRQLTLRAAVAATDGSRAIREAVGGPVSDAVPLAEDLLRRLAAAGALALLRPAQ